jgi:hypothetical protein
MQNALGSLVFRREINREGWGVEFMRRDKNIILGPDAETNRPAVFTRDATAAAKRPARFAAKKTRAAIAVLALLSSPSFAGPPYVTDDPEPVDYQRWEFYVFSQGGRANGETNGVAPSCDCNYGVLPDVQLHIQPGAAFRRASGASPAWGPSDMEFGLKYRFVEQDKTNATNATPSIAFYPLLEAPTGDPTRMLGAGRTRALLPFWGQKDFGDWSTFGGGGYWINPGPGAKNYWFVGWVLQRKLTEQLAVGVELFHQTPSKIGGFQSTGFNVGAIYDLSEHFHLLASVGKGLQHARETNAFSWYLGLQITGVE